MLFTNSTSSMGSISATGRDPRFCRVDVDPESIPGCRYVPHYSTPSRRLRGDGWSMGRGNKVATMTAVFLAIRSAIWVNAVGKFSTGSYHGALWRPIKRSRDTSLGPISFSAPSNRYFQRQKLPPVGSNEQVKAAAI